MLDLAPLAPAASIAIPVCNEVERIGACLHALTAQLHAPTFEVLLLLNGCNDGTQAEVAGLIPRLPFRVHVVEDLSAAPAGAGFARCHAFMEAARRAPGATLLTTDADAHVPQDWVARNLDAIAGGADAVAGRAIIDPVEALAIPQRLHEDDARECAYAALLDEIASLADPDPFDPWPRHDEHSGASFAVTQKAWAAAGGIPELRLGEDRAFFRALRRIDARIRHDPAIRVIVSGRVEGRAAGGMADTMRRRMTCPDAFLDERLEPALSALRRARLRAMARAAWPAPDPRLARQLGISRGRLRALLSQPCFGAAWEAIEAASPVLRHVHVPVVDVEAQTRAARRILAGLSRCPADRVANDLSVALRVG